MSQEAELTRSLLDRREEIGARAFINALDVVHVLPRAIARALGFNALLAALVFDLRGSASTMQW